MTEAVQILISADDQASKEMAQAALNIEQSTRKVEAVLKSLETPTDRYNKELAELIALQKSGALSAVDFGRAQAALESKLKGNANAFKEIGGKVKATSEFVGILGNLTGGSEIGQYAGQLAQITEKAGQFSEVAKGGGAGALAFKAGLVALVGTLAFNIGKALGDVIFQTEKFNREMEETKRIAGELSNEMLHLANKTIELERRDIELIADPEEKKRKYAELLNRLNLEVAGVSSQVERSKKTVEEWNEAWQITGERKASAEMAKAELENDEERLKMLKAQRDAIRDLTSERTAAVEAQKRENEENAKSKDYLESLRQEVAYMKATREEQIKMDAAKNTTGADTGEAEKLLAERDAIEAKREADAKLEEERKRAAEEEVRRKEKAAADEAKRIEKEAELQKKAAEDQMKRNEAIAKHAAEVRAKNIEVANKLAEQKKQEEQRLSEKQQLTATESRLGTRGSTDQGLKDVATNTKQALAKQDRIIASLDAIHADNTKKKAGLELQVIA